MSGSFLAEIFTPEFEYKSKAIVTEQKFELDYMDITSNTLTVLGVLDAEYRDYLRMNTKEGVIYGLVQGVEYTETETKITWCQLLGLLDVDVYHDRTDLATMTCEKFLGAMIEENFLDSGDEEQDLPGLTMEYTTETESATLNLTDNMHNIYELCLKAFRKYGITVTMTVDVMEKTLTCSIGVPDTTSRTIEADLKNIISTKITLAESDESVNKVYVIGVYDDEDSDSYGETVERVYYKDGDTGDTTMTPTSRVTPVVFKYCTISIDEDTFEDDAFDQAYDYIYQEAQDNEIAIELRRDDPLYPLSNFEIGASCDVIKDGTVYGTVYTGWKFNATSVTLLFGLVRTAYTKSLRRLKTYS